MYLDTSYCRYDAAAKHLYCTLPWSQFTVRVRSWGEGCRIDVQEKDKWSAEYDAIDLPVVSDLLTGGDAGHPIARYARELPPEVAQGVAAFEYGQIAMLQVCAASSRGEQLLRNAPVLLWLIAPDVLRKSGAEPAAAHALLGLRQRDLLALSCGRGNNALLRLLAKISPLEAARATQEVLTDILEREEASSLLHHKYGIDGQLLALVTRLGDKVRYPLVRDIIMSDMQSASMQRAISELDRIIDDTSRLGRQLGIVDAARHVAACSSWRVLARLHDTWAERMNSGKLDDMVQKYGNELPLPPLPGTDAIQPIRSVRELLLEGMTMHHCVGSYIDEVRSGECYIYRVMEPGRATLEIRRDGSGAWVQGQLKAHCNGRPGMDVARQVQKWLYGDGSIQPSQVVRY